MKRNEKNTRSLMKKIRRKGKREKIQKGMKREKKNVRKMKRKKIEREGEKEH